MVGGLRFNSGIVLRINLSTHTLISTAVIGRQSRTTLMLGTLGAEKQHELSLLALNAIAVSVNYIAGIRELNLDCFVQFDHSFRANFNQSPAVVTKACRGPIWKHRVTCCPFWSVLFV